MTTVIAIEKNTSLYCLFEFFWRRYRHRVLWECSISYEYYVRAVRLDFCLPPIWSRRNCICCYFMCGFFFQFFFFPVFFFVDSVRMVFLWMEWAAKLSKKNKIWNRDEKWRDQQEGQNKRETLSKKKKNCCVS